VRGLPAHPIMGSKRAQDEACAALVGDVCSLALSPPMQTEKTLEMARSRTPAGDYEVG